MDKDSKRQTKLEDSGGGLLPAGEGHRLEYNRNKQANFRRFLNPALPHGGTLHDRLLHRLPCRLTGPLQPPSIRAGRERSGGTPVGSPLSVCHWQMIGLRAGNSNGIGASRLGHKLDGVG